jgi:hypothetical protein
MKINQHSQQISPEVFEQVVALINQAAELLKPSLFSLTSADRTRMIKLGPKSLDFVEKAREVVLQQPDILPRNFSNEDYEIDYNDVRNLYKLRLLLSGLTRNVEDTEMRAGSELMDASLVVYHAVKSAAERNELSVKPFYDELKKRFPGTRKRSDESSENSSGSE